MAENNSGELLPGTPSWRIYKPEPWGQDVMRHKREQAQISEKIAGELAVDAAIPDDVALEGESAS